MKEMFKENGNLNGLIQHILSIVGFNLAFLLRIFQGCRPNNEKMSAPE